MKSILMIVPNENKWYVKEVAAERNVKTTNVKRWLSDRLIIELTGPSKGIRETKKALKGLCYGIYN